MSAAGWSPPGIAAHLGLLQVAEGFDVRARADADVAQHAMRTHAHAVGQRDLAFEHAPHVDEHVAAEHDLAAKCEVLFSPSHQQVDARALADWIIADNLPVRFQLQLHKILWNDEPGH